MRYEVGSVAWSAIINRNGRNYYFPLEMRPTLMVAMFITAFGWVANGNAGVPNAYRVSPNAWTMVTLTNEGNGGVAKTYIDGGVVQSQNLTNDIYIENIKPIYIAANENGNANWYKGSIQDFRLYNDAFTDAEVATLFSSVDANPVL